MSIRALVHVIDDDPAIRDAMRCLLSSVDLDVVCYASAQAFLDAPRSIHPGCIIMDLRMPDMSGLELQQRCAERWYRKPILFLTGYGDVQSSVRAMQQGASEFLTKPVNDELMLEKIRAAIDRDRGQQIESNRYAAIQARLDLLTPRENEVLTAIVDGCTNKDIAQKLGISPKTVELHRHNLMTKMHADSLAELVRGVVELRSMLRQPHALL